MTYSEHIEKNRSQKDKFLANSHQSPLSPSAQRKFSHLDYFPVNKDYRYQLELQAFDNPETIEMDTSDGRTRKYRRIGYLKFNVDDEESKIHVYQSASNSDHYFIPFRDETSGKETYGAGRYLDIERNPDGTFNLDFNLAYNPFCAYSDAYSCPLPPIENWLDIPIKAGEKAFQLNN